MALAELTAEAIADCCGSRHWQTLMGAGLPYATRDALLRASEAAFDHFSRDDWMQAFAAHSLIGAPRAGDAIGAHEQAGLAAADGELRMAMAAGNLEYQRRFGFVFLIRASGRTAPELLAALRERSTNPVEVEFAHACAAQREITARRLTGLAVR